jgi:hypothetical protein
MRYRLNLRARLPDDAKLRSESQAMGFRFRKHKFAFTFEAQRQVRVPSRVCKGAPYLSAWLRGKDQPQKCALARLAGFLRRVGYL